MKIENIVAAALERITILKHAILTIDSDGHCSGNANAKSERKQAAIADSEALNPIHRGGFGQEGNLPRRGKFVSLIRRNYIFCADWSNYRGSYEA